MRYVASLCLTIAACTHDAPSSEPQPSRVEAAPARPGAPLGSEARFGTTPHAEIDARAFVGAFQSPTGEAIEFRDDGTYGWWFGGRSTEGDWYAFGAHVEFDETTSWWSDRGFDLVGVVDELVLVHDDRLSKFVIDVKSGFELPREYLRRAAPVGTRKPDLPPPYDALARARSASVDIAEWRSTYRAAALESHETLVLDDASRFTYVRGGCWQDDETGEGRVDAFGELLMLTCDTHTAPYLAQRMLYVPLRRDAQRLLVACDDLADLARVQRTWPHLVDDFYLHDDGEPASERWTAPTAFSEWFADDPLSARVLRVGENGPPSRTVPVITLDVGRTHGAFRGLGFEPVDTNSSALRVVLVRETECDAVPAEDEGRSADWTVGACFRSLAH